MSLIKPTCLELMQALRSNSPSINGLLSQVIVELSALSTDTARNECEFIMVVLMKSLPVSFLHFPLQKQQELTLQAFSILIQTTSPSFFQAREDLFVELFMRAMSSITIGQGELDLDVDEEGKMYAVECMQMLLHEEETFIHCLAFLKEEGKKEYTKALQLVSHLCLEMANKEGLKSLRGAALSLLEDVIKTISTPGLSLILPGMTSRVVDLALADFKAGPLVPTNALKCLCELFSRLIEEGQKPKLATHDLMRSIVTSVPVHPSTPLQTRDIELNKLISKLFHPNVAPSKHPTSRTQKGLLCGLLLKRSHFLTPLTHKLVVVHLVGATLDQHPSTSQEISACLRDLHPDTYAYVLETALDDSLNGLLPLARRARGDETVFRFQLDAIRAMSGCLTRPLPLSDSLVDVLLQVLQLDPLTDTSVDESMYCRLSFVYFHEPATIRAMQRSIQALSVHHPHWGASLLVRTPTPALLCLLLFSKQADFGVLQSLCMLWREDTLEGTSLALSIQVLGQGCAFLEEKSLNLLLTESLFLVLEFSVSSNTQVSCAASQTLVVLAHAMHLPSISALLWANIDYVVDVLIRRLASIGTDINLGTAIRALLKYVDVFPSTHDKNEPLIRDLVASLFQALDQHSVLSRQILGLLQVMSSLVLSMQEVEREEMNPPSPLEDVGVRLKYLFPEHGGVGFDPDGVQVEEGALRSKDGEKNDETSPEQLVPPLAQTTLLQIASRVTHFFSHANLRVRRLSFELFAECLPRISLLKDVRPLLHQAWTPLIEQAKEESNPYAFKVLLNTLTTCAHQDMDFMEGRVEADLIKQVLLPILRQRRSPLIHDKMLLSATKQNLPQQDEQVLETSGLVGPSLECLLQLDCPSLFQDVGGMLARVSCEFLTSNMHRRLIILLWKEKIIKYALPSVFLQLRVLSGRECEYVLEKGFNMSKQDANFLYLCV